jgi:integrase
VVALTPAQVADIRVKLHGFAETKQVDAKGRSVGSRGKVWYDLEDIVDAMLSTGGRIGEVLACDGEDVHATEQEVILAHHVVRISGEGLVRQELRKGNEEGLVLAVPAWSVPMWRRRKLASGGGKLFPSWNGEWLDPSNVIGRLKEALTAIGYGWLTSHVLRKTAAKVLDDANLPTSAIADQLGNSQKVVEKHYRRKRASNQAAAAALEVLG